MSMSTAKCARPRPARGNCRPRRTRNRRSASPTSPEGVAMTQATELKLPHPEPNGDSRPYWDAARERRFLIRECKACCAKHFMPRHQCPECWSDQLEWIESPGEGTVQSYSVVHRAPTPEFSVNGPYVIALIDLDEGPRVF